MRQGLVFSAIAGCLLRFASAEVTIKVQFKGAASQSSCQIKGTVLMVESDGTITTDLAEGCRKCQFCQVRQADAQKLGYRATAYARLQSYSKAEGFLDDASVLIPPPQSVRAPADGPGDLQPLPAVAAALVFHNGSCHDPRKPCDEGKECAEGGGHSIRLACGTTDITIDRKLVTAILSRSVTTYAMPIRVFAGLTVSQKKGDKKGDRKADVLGVLRVSPDRFKDRFNNSVVASFVLNPDRLTYYTVQGKTVNWLKMEEDFTSRLMAERVHIFDIRGNQVMEFHEPSRKDRFFGRGQSPTVAFAVKFRGGGDLPVMPAPTNRLAKDTGQAERMCVREFHYEQVRPPTADVRMRPTAGLSSRDSKRRSSIS